MVEERSRSPMKPCNEVIENFDVLKKDLSSLNTEGERFTAMCMDSKETMVT